MAEFDESQLLRGTLEGCILKVISIHETYGYEIMDTLVSYGFQDVREGTIYPLLLRLEKKGLITYRFLPSPLGPSRKYYSISNEGARMLASFRKCWEGLSVTVTTILSLEDQ